MDGRNAGMASSSRSSKKKDEPHSQQAGTSDASRPGKEEASYFLSAGGESRKGPYTFKEISNWYATGQLSPEAFLWKEGMAEWVRVGEFVSGYQEESSFWVGVFGMLSSLTGLSPIERFSLKSIFKGIPPQDGAGKDRFFYVRRVEIYPSAGRNIYGLAFAMALHPHSRAFPVDMHRVETHV